MVQDDQFEETFKYILSDNDVNLNVSGIEDCHRLGKSESKKQNRKKNRCEISLQKVL